MAKYAEPPVTGCCICDVTVVWTGAGVWVHQGAVPRNHSQHDAVPDLPIRHSPRDVERWLAGPLHQFFPPF